MKNRRSIWKIFLTFARNKLVGMNKQNNISTLSAKHREANNSDGCFSISITVIQNDVTTVFIC